MNTSFRIVLLLSFMAGAVPAEATDKTAGLIKQPPRAQDLSFVENRNQWEAPIRYKADLPGGSVFLTKEGFTYAYYNLQDLARIHELGHDQPRKNLNTEMVNCHAYRVTFLGAQANPRMEAGDKRSTYHNYFLDRDSSRWAGNVPLFGKVVYRDLYTGIDAAVYSKGTSMKYDFIVAPGADPASIRLRYEGVTPHILPNGNLRIKTSVNEVEEAAPYTYQVIDGLKKEVKAKYVWDAKTSSLHFEFPEGYDMAAGLVIDPTLVFATYSGSTGYNWGFSAAYDNDGNLYVAAEVYGSGWPTTTGAYQVNFTGINTNIGLNKYNSTGTNLVYSTYYGNSTEKPASMIVNAQDEPVICGFTTSSGLPVTTGCYDNTLNGNVDIFVVHFNATGSALIGATYVGGNGWDGYNSIVTIDDYDLNRCEVITDALGNIYVASNTASNDFPVTATAVQASSGGGQDGCIFKLNPGCSSLLYSSYLGGSGEDACYGLAFNSAGHIVTIGGTLSTDFPTLTGGLHPTAPGGEADGFAAVINTASATPVAATYLGTAARDLALKVQVDVMDNIYVMGQTLGNYPVSAGVYNLAGHDIFIDKLNPGLSASLLSTRLGNIQTTDDQQWFKVPSFFLDECGSAYLCGFHPNTTLPVTPDAFATAAAIANGGLWMGVLEPGFAALSYATFIEGGDHMHGTSRFDPKRGMLYHAMCTVYSSLPTSPGVWAPAMLLPGNNDCAGFKFNFEAGPVHAAYSLAAGANDSGCVSHTVTFINGSTGATDYVWDFGDNTPTTTTVDATHTFTAPGVYTVTLYASNPTAACPSEDSFKSDIHVFEAVTPQINARDTVLCMLQPVTITVDVGNPAAAVTYAWTPIAGIIGSPNQQTVTVDPGIAMDYIVTVTNINALCTASATDTLHIEVIDLTQFDLLNGDTVICKGQTIPLVALGDTSFNYQWSPDIDISDANVASTTATPLQSRRYMITVSAANCPPHHDSFRVTVEPAPEVNAGPDHVLCSYDTVQLFAAVLPSNFSNYTYLWQPGLNLTDSTSATPVFNGDESTNLEVIVKTPAGCTDRDSVTLIVHPGDFLVVSPDTGVCPPALVQLNASGAVSYKWSPDYGLSDTDIANPIATPGTPVTYTAVGLNQFNCVDSQQVTVDVYPQAVIALTDTVNIWPGESYTMDPQGNCLYFQWFPTSGLTAGNISNPDASPEVRTRYFVTATTEHGCTIIDSIDVRVNEESILDMPNAFTPNNDGVNGTLKVSRRGIATLRYFRIFNRWGNKVFESTDIDKGWDGRYNNTPQPMGVYIYSIEALTNKGKPYIKQGNVTLIR